MKTTGERIIYLRNRQGISQAELARRAGIGQSTLHGYENGNRSTQGMSVAIAQRLARALGVSLDYLTGMYDAGELQPTGEALVGT